MNKTDLLLQMMEQPQHYTAEEWQEILADEECREIYTLLCRKRRVPLMLPVPIRKSLTT